VGYVFQDRYPFELTRCVVLNPVRTRMISDAAMILGSAIAPWPVEHRDPEWLNTDCIPGQFEGHHPQAIACCIDFVPN
jgi:hypothetical protein